MAEPRFVWSDPAYGSRLYGMYIVLQLSAPAVKVEKILKGVKSLENEPNFK